MRVDGGIILRKSQATLKKIAYPLVQTARRQGAVRLAGDLGAHGTSHGNHDAHAKRLKFETQGAGVRDDGALGGAVDGAKGVGGHGGEGRNVDDEAFGSDELVGKGGAHGHDAKDIGLKGFAHIVEVDVGGGVGVSPAATLLDRTFFF